MNDHKQKFFGYISYIIIAVILSVTILGSCYIGVKGLADYKRATNEIDVKGMATQEITSDVIDWTGYYDVQTKDLQEGYTRLEADKEKVKNYLVGKELKEEDLIFSAIDTGKFNDDVLSSDGTTVVSTTEYFILSQTVSINSTEVDKVTEISRSATDLINEGVQFKSCAPEYHYTKLADLKLKLLEEATKDATTRAEIIAENSKSKLGKLSYAHVSSFNIAPLYLDASDNNDSYDYYYDDYYYDYDNTDKETATLEKEIKLVVYCAFEIN